MENCFVALPAVLLAFTVKVAVPALVGVPEITPVVARVKPVGNVPLSRLHEIGVSPDAASTCLYAIYKVPFDNVPVVIIGATGATAIVMDNDFVSCPLRLLAFMVKVDVPTVVGVPEIAPFAAKLKPAGNVPLSRLHVMGMSPVASSVWLYAVPTIPFGNVSVLIAGAVLVIVMKSGVAWYPAALVALTEKEDVPAIVGVPEITPVSSMLKPSGNGPLSCLHVMGASPVATSVWLYSVPTAPFGNTVALIIVGGTLPSAVGIVMESDLLLFPTALLAFTVKIAAPALVGVPKITPAVARVKPAGNAPLSMLHAMGASPVASSIWRYAVPTIPFDNVSVIIVGATPSSIIIENCFVLFPAELVAFTVKVKVPTLVGVPEI
jgi:hypothetical protein